MLINIEQLEDWIAKGIVQPDAGWGDAQETACLMSGLTGETSIEGCKAKGWPQWLAELGTTIFDNAGDDWKERSIAFANAVNSADERGVDFDEVFAEIRMTAILPIAMESIGKGDESWRIRCRNVVQTAMDNGGSPMNKEQRKEAAEAAEAAWAAWAAGAAEAAGAAGAAWAAWAAEAAGAAGAAGAAEAAGAAGAAWAARAAEAAGAAGAAAHTRIFSATIAALESAKGAS